MSDDRKGDLSDAWEDIIRAGNVGARILAPASTGAEGAIHAAVLLIEIGACIAADCGIDPEVAHKAIQSIFAEADGPTRRMCRYVAARRIAKNAIARAASRSGGKGGAQA